MHWKSRTSAIALLACAAMAPAAAAVASVPDKTTGLGAEQRAAQAAARPPVRADTGLGAEQRAAQAAARLPFNGSLVAEQQAAEAADGAQQPGTLQPPTPSSSPVARPAGFHWGDAGIGAGVVLALALLGAGGAFLVVRRREPQVATGRRRSLAS